MEQDIPLTASSTQKTKKYDCLPRLHPWRGAWWVDDEEDLRDQGGGGTEGRQQHSWLSQIQGWCGGRVPPSAQLDRGRHQLTGLVRRRSP